jgi:aminoglycoside phosphotransferase
VDTDDDLLALLPPRWRHRSWVPVRIGCSGATVLRLADGTAHVKLARGAGAGVVRGERVRAEWLAGTEVLGPEPLDWYDDGDRVALVTRTVPGIPVSEVPTRLVPAAVASVILLLRAVHALPVDSCPTVRRVGDILAGVDFSDAGQAGRPGSATDAQAEYRRAAELGRDRAERAEVDDLVVCHGDPCLPNLMVDADTGAPVGVVDVGLLGVADRHHDLALASRSTASAELNPQFSTRYADQILAAFAPVDAWRIDYYRLLDELI